MSHPGTFRRLLPVLAALALACAAEEEQPVEATPDYEAAESARFEEAMVSLRTVSKRVRAEVLRTCDKWKHVDRPCVEDEIRRDQLDCWLRAGEQRWKHAQKRGMGHFSGDRMTMRAQNACLQQRRWRKVDPSHRF